MVFTVAPLVMTFSGGTWLRGGESIVGKAAGSEPGRASRLAEQPSEMPNDEYSARAREKSKIWVAKLSFEINLNKV
jgi:hypothetical protein